MKRRCRFEHLDGDAPGAHVILDNRRLNSVRRRFALRGSSATLSRVETARVCLGTYREVVRNARMDIDTGLAGVFGSMVVCGAAVVKGFEKSADGMGLSTSPTLITECVDDVCTIASTPCPWDGVWYILMDLCVPC